MKTILFSFIFLVLIPCSKIKAQHLQKIWETPAGLITPESALYDEERDVIYVSNINGDPATKDGNGFISVLNANGTIKDLTWIKRLNAPKGMAIYKDYLYVADLDQLLKIDLKKGKITNRYKVTEPVFLNDVSICSNGMVFVSDNRNNKIYVLFQNEFKVWLEGEPFKTPNGLLAEKGKLYVGDENIYEVDVLTLKINLVIEETGGVDGLCKNNEGEFVFSNWPGKIFINRDGKNIKLLDTTEQNINTADIDFALKYDLLLVPTFFNNKVVAYKIVD